MTGHDTPVEQVTVFYDGQCPICTREIGFYQGLRKGDEIRWVDVAETDGDPLPSGLTRDAALARFHVQTKTGELVSGGKAFATLWASLPAFRWAGRVLQTRFFTAPLEALYRLSLPCRSLLQRVLPAPGRRTGCRDSTGQSQ